MLEMIEHSHEQHNIEIANAVRRKLIYIHLAVCNTRTESRAHLAEARIVPVVDGQNLRAAALHLKREPAVPSADIEHAFTREILWDREFGDTVAQAFERANTFDKAPVGEFKAMPPPRALALFVPVPNVIEWIAGRRLRHHTFRIRRRRNAANSMLAMTPAATSKLAKRHSLRSRPPS